MCPPPSEKKTDKDQKWHFKLDTFNVFSEMIFLINLFGIIIEKKIENTQKILKIFKC